jgi:hypothetical protein
MTASMVAELPPPPFCAELLAELAAGNIPGIRLFCGRDGPLLAGMYCEHFGPGSAAAWPDDADPTAFRWPAGGTLTALCLGRTKRIKELRRALFTAFVRDDVRFVLACDEGQTVITRGTAVCR